MRRPRGWTPVLTLDHEYGTAAVYRDAEEGDLILSGTGHPGGSVLQGYEPGHEQVEDATIAGGLVPPGATAVLVRTAQGDMRPASVGGGAWLARLDGTPFWGGVVARFEDRSGRLVEAPPPDGATTVPLSDAADPCPACDAVEWQLARWRREWIEGEFTEDLEAPRCARCGYIEQLGVRSTSEAETGGEYTEEELPDDWEEQERAEAREVLANVRFPIYGLSERWAGGRAIGGWGADSRSGPTNVDLYHGETLYEEVKGPHVVVDTTRAHRHEVRDEVDRCREALAGLFSDEEPDRDLDHASRAAVSTWFAASQRVSSEEAYRATRLAATILVDGKPVEFQLLEAGSRWTACARIGRVFVTITARDVDRSEVELVRIEDTDPYL
jgi:hypothetical protein